MKQFSLFLICILFAFSAFGAKYNYASIDQDGVNVVNVAQSNKTTGDCAASTASYELDLNNIRANLLLAGDFWWDGSEDGQYEFPKGSGKHTLYSGALWFTGLDDANQLRCSAQTYRSGGHDFWTGPLNQFGQVEATTCSAFDRTWTVESADIDAFLAAFDAEGGVSLSTGSIPQALLDWPGRANPHLAGTEFFYDLGSLAPFYDYDGNGIYDPTGGDYPIIKQCDGVDPQYADEMVFWVSNDEGNVHSRSLGTALGVQINSLAFAFSTSNDLNNMTFYTYEMVKRSAGSLHETYMGVFVDPDNGGPTDDYVGCDTARSLGYVYNANTPDAIYNYNIPITGVDFFEGPVGDNGEQLGMSSFVYFTNTTGNQSDPDNAAEFRNYQTSLWKDGSPITYGGSGINGTDSTDYVFPDDPTLAGGWSEHQETGTGNGADRRFVQNSGPFTLSSGESQRITIGAISVMVDAYQPGNESINATIGSADDLAQSLFDNCFGIIGGPDAPDLLIRELSNELLITLKNEPSSNNYAESYEQEAAGAQFGSDNTYNFEGYKVFQLANSEVTAQDLNDDTKAILVYQSDLKNGVSSIYNFFEDPNVPGQYVSAYDDELNKVEGADEGVSRSFKLTTDRFTGGDLVNHKTYYYGAIAYAHNDFLTYTGPWDPATEDAPQLQPYLQGIGNFNVYTAIPHIIDSRNGGTVLNSEFGESVEVRRLEGQGNGGNHINLSQETEDLIVANNFEDILNYEIGYDPIGLKIVDPLEVKDVDFELWILSSTKTYDTTIIDNGTSIDTTVEIVFLPATTFSDSSFWELRVYEEDGALIETIVSEKTLDNPYDQYIEDYGITINVGTPEPIGVNADNNASIYDVISSSIEFADPTDSWLSFLGDEASGTNTSSDWVRSGTNIFATPANVYDSYQYATSDFYDPNNVFGDMISGNFAPYCLAANYADETPGASAPAYGHGPGFKHDLFDPSGTVTPNVSTLENLQSVELVLTNDITKWSKCIVLETGVNTNFTIGNARKGQLRQSSSIDAFGNTIAGSNGMSYFPGYAINKETGERMMLAFGESSDRTDNNGGDMIWNPTSKQYDALGDADAVFGGKHFIYVVDRPYAEADVEGVAAIFDAADFTANAIDPNVADFYKDIMYTSIPLVGDDFLPMSEGLIPSDVRISLNVEANYNVFATSEVGNNGMPRYGFSTVGLGAEANVTTVAEGALDNIRVVPNPYYGYSSYETSQLDNLVKVTNLPNECTVGIYTLDGKLVREFERAVGNSGESTDTRQEISDGQIKSANTINLDNSITWNLKNESAIAVGSGTYIIHINAPGIGEHVVKAAVYLRPADVSNF